MSDEDDFDQFLRAARDGHAASTSPEDEAKRVEASLGKQVSWRRHLPAAGAAALTTATSKRFATRTKVLAALLPILGVSLVSYAVATTRGSSTSIVESKPASAPVPSVQSHSQSIEAAPVLTLAGPSELPDAKDVPEAKPDHAPKPSAPSTPSTRRGDDGTLDAELAQLAQVTSALQTNRPARALTVVDEHDHRFPNGVLAPEFAAQRVLALAALGRQSEACAESSAFLAKYPKSPLVSQVRSSCDDPNRSR